MFRAVSLVLFGVAVVCTAGSPCATAAPIPRHLLWAAENPDLAAMQGKWKLTDIAFDGKSLGADFAAELQLSLEVQGNATVTIGVKHKQRVTSVLIIDTNAKPRRVTFSETKETDLDGNPVQNPDAKKMSVAIYKIEGGTLTIAGQIGDGENAPKDFDGKGVVSMTYTRVKK